MSCHLRAAGYRPADGREATHSVEELALLVEETEEAGVLGREQAEVVQKAFRLSGKRVRDCMVPRDEVAALELHTLALTEALLRGLGAIPEQINRERERVHAELIGRPTEAGVEESAQEQPAAGPESPTAIRRDENEAERKAGWSKETCHET
jgi:hypothetical protein